MASLCPARKWNFRGNGGGENRREKDLLSLLDAKKEMSEKVSYFLLYVKFSFLKWNQAHTKVSAEFKYTDRWNDL